MSMISWQMTAAGEPLQRVEGPMPEPGEGEVLLRMGAAAVNPLDDTVRLGHFPAARRPPLVPGIEGVGVVVEPGASGLAEGARVMLRGAYGVARDGTWREYVAADACANRPRASRGSWTTRGPPRKSRSGSC